MSSREIHLELNETQTSIEGFGKLPEPPKPDEEKKEPDKSALQRLLDRLFSS